MSDKPSWFDSVPPKGKIFLVAVVAILVLFGLWGVLTS